MSRSTAKATLDQRVGDPDAKWLTPTRLKETVDVIYDDASGGSLTLNLLDYCAGDGTTDDTAGINSAIAALQNGMTLIVPSGHTFKHTDNIVVNGFTNLTVTGGGTIAHVGDADSTGGLAFEDCYDLTVENLTLTSTATTRRSGDYSHRLFIYQCGQVAIRDITVVGSAAAGILLDTVNGFDIRRCNLSYTLADTLHMTHETRNGTVTDIVSDHAGDDGVAIVSYETRPTRVRNIDISNVTVTNQLWGRGMSVVGGQNITYRDCNISNSAAAGLYIACEGSYSTFGVDGVTFDNITFDACCQQASDTPALRPKPGEAAIKHSPVTVFNGRNGYEVKNIFGTNVTITNTEPDAYDEVLLVIYDVLAPITRLDFNGFNITTSKSYIVNHTLLSSGDYNTKTFVVNGSTIADHVGWQYGAGGFLSTAGGTLTGPLAGTSFTGTTMVKVDDGAGHSSVMYPTYTSTGIGYFTNVTATSTIKSDDGAGNSSTLNPTYLSSGIAYLTNVQATGSSVIAFDTAPRNGVKSGALSIVRNGSNSGSTIIAAYPTAADETAGTNAYFELRGAGALKIGAAVNPEDATQKSYVDDKAPYRVYVQSATPSPGAGIPYLWIDTTGGNIQIKVEDGL